MSCIVRQDLPTPPPPTTTSLYSRRNWVKGQIEIPGKMKGPSDRAGRTFEDIMQRTSKERKDHSVKRMLIMLLRDNDVQGQRDVQGNRMEDREMKGDRGRRSWQENLKWTGSAGRVCVGGWGESLESVMVVRAEGWSGWHR